MDDENQLPQIEEELMKPTPSSPNRPRGLPDKPDWSNARKLTASETRRFNKIFLEMFVQETMPKDDALIYDLDIDSLDMIEAIISLEEEFSIEISDPWQEAIKTVDDMRKCVAFCIDWKKRV